MAWNVVEFEELGRDDPDMHHLIGSTCSKRNGTHRSHTPGIANEVKKRFSLSLHPLSWTINVIAVIVYLVIPEIKVAVVYQILLGLVQRESVGELETC